MQYAPRSIGFLLTGWVGACSPFGSTAPDEPSPEVPDSGTDAPSAPSPVDGGARCVSNASTFCDSFDGDWMAGWTPNCVNGATIDRSTELSYSAPGALVAFVPDNASAESRCELLHRIAGHGKIHIRARVYVDASSRLSSDFTNIFRAGYASDKAESTLVFVALTKEGVRVVLTGAPQNERTLGPVFPTGRWVDVALDIDPATGAKFTYGDAQASVTWSPLAPSGNPQNILWLGGSRFAVGSELRARYDDLEFRIE